MTIRQGDLHDLETMQQLFVETIQEVCKYDYTEEQISAWTSSVENKQRWQDILSTQFVLVAEQADELVGFCTLDKGEYLDLLYVRKDKQGQGIAKKLYQEIEIQARRQNAHILNADVSKTAKPFFESLGFEILSEQSINIKGVGLTNFKMAKKLSN